MSNTETETAGVMDSTDRSMNPSVREALSELQVNPIGGALIQTFAQQIDYAKTMARGTVAIPKHLRDNQGACLAMVDISVRFGFSPYMVANKTYIQADRLCFESQLVHAMIERSGVLQKRLRFEHSGEGDERRVKVIGFLKGEPEPFIYESEMLKDLHPGHVEKESNGVKKRFVSGSQLWDDKPDVQLIYNATYDWARINCPDVLMAMGVPPPDQRFEDEHRYVGPEAAKDITPSGIHERLSATAASGNEGGHPATINGELDEIASGATGAPAGASAPEGDKGAAPAGEPTSQRALRKRDATGTTRKKADAKAEPKAPAKAEPKPEPERKPEPEKAAAPASPPAGKKPKTPAEWSVYARAEIARLFADGEGSSSELKKWWNGDRSVRNDCGLTQAERMPVEEIYLDCIAKLEEHGR